MAPFTMSGNVLKHALRNPPAGQKGSSPKNNPSVSPSELVDRTSTWAGRPYNAKANTLLLVIILAAIMALGIAMAIRPIRVRAMREKETELIYRGEHISRGIRDYYFRMGRFPYDLEDLLEIEPRLIRKLYKDPITESGEWELVYLGQENRNSMELLKKKFLEINHAEPRKSYDRSSGSGTQIVGIKSRSQETGYRQYQGSQIYSDWFFNALSGNRANSLDSLKSQLPK